MKLIGAFNARELHFWTLDILYRVYVTTQGMGFIRIGGDGGWSYLAGQGGGPVVGGLYEAWISADRRRRIDIYDERSLGELLRQHPHNHFVWRVELTECRIAPPSLWANHWVYIALWYYSSRRTGRRTLQFETKEDRRRAEYYLPIMLRSRP